jgi:hypothetical protein
MQLSVIMVRGNRAGQRLWKAVSKVEDSLSRIKLEMGKALDAK